MFLCLVAKGFKASGQVFNGFQNLFVFVHEKPPFLCSTKLLYHSLRLNSKFLGFAALRGTGPRATEWRGVWPCEGQALALRGGGACGLARDRSSRYGVVGRVALRGTGPRATGWWGVWPCEGQVLALRGGGACGLARDRSSRYGVVGRVALRGTGPRATGWRGVWPCEGQVLALRSGGACGLARDRPSRYGVAGVCLRRGEGLSLVLRAAGAVDYRLTPNSFAMV